MNGPSLAAIAAAWLVGTLVVAALWPRMRALRGDSALILPLGLGLGLGLTSALFFVSTLLARDPLTLCIGLEFVVAVAAGAVLGRRSQTDESQPRCTARGTFLRTAVLASLFGQAALGALIVAVRAYHIEPYSNSDGWVIWNMHARFLFRGGVDWPALLGAPPLTWTHPDYPLLVPASVARAWAYAGHDGPVVAGVISTLFGVATVWLLVAAGRRLRHAHVAWIGGLLLLGTPFFVTFSSNQHADIPLGFYILAALTLTANLGHERATAGMAALAGIFAGLAAWTKNEGILFVVVLAACWVAAVAVRRAWREAGGFGGGLLIALLPLLYFKFALSPANDIVSSQPWSRIGQVLDWSRHRLILMSLWRDLRGFGEWSVLPFAVMLPPLIGNGWRRIQSREWLVAAALVLTFAGYYAIYLVTHWDLREHLDSSLVRLLLQLWPSSVLFWCLAATYESQPPNTPVPAREISDQPLQTTRQLRRRGLVVVLANVAIAAGALVLLGRQLAANELAVATIDATRIHVLLGDGWFGRETLGADRWAWSKGKSTLLLRADGPETRTITLRFEMRSLGERTVTARVSDRMVWRGIVRDEAATVEIAGLSVNRSVLAIDFQTEEPGVRESDGPGARALTFAVYKPEVKK